MNWKLGRPNEPSRAWPRLGPDLEAVAQLPCLDQRRGLDRKAGCVPGLSLDGAYSLCEWLGWPDAFPPGDVAVLKALGLADMGKGARAESLADTRSQAWRPWRAYAVLRL